MEKSTIMTLDTGTWSAEEYRREIIFALVSALKAPFLSGKAEFEKEEATQYWFLLDLLGRLLQQCPTLEEKSEIQALPR